MNARNCARIAGFLSPVLLLVVGCDGQLSGLAPGRGLALAGAGAEAGVGSGRGGETLAAGGSSPLDCATMASRAALPARLRRLTQAEYVNSVRALVGDEIALPPLEFPPDAALGTFHDAASLLRVTDLLADGLSQFAEQLAQTATAPLANLLGCDPTLDELGCVSPFLGGFAEKAYRRPLGDGERQRLLDVYAQGRTGADVRSGVALALQLIFQSPHLLYRTELGPRDGAVAQASLTGPELASELAYLVTASPPDAELSRAALAGELAAADARTVQAQRLLQQASARTSLATFASEWLDIGQLPKLTKDPALFPAFSPDKAREMQRATEQRFDAAVFEGDGKLRSLLRGGLLTEPSVLAAHAGPQWSSPTHRGKLIRNQLLCQQVPPPPPGLIVTVPPAVPGVTTRQRLLTHASDPSCNACHARMDPLGFAFEHYDAVGSFRADEGGLVIDTSGEVTGSADADGAFDGAEALSQRLADSAAVRECFAKQWATYAMGAEVTDALACSLAETLRDFAAERLSLTQLLLRIVGSEAFAKRQVTE